MRVGNWERCSHSSTVWKHQMRCCSKQQVADPLARHAFPPNRRSAQRRCAVSRIAASSIDREQQPWQIATYYTKKHTRNMDELGNMQDNETIELLNADRKLQLAVQVTARDTGMPEAELMQRVESLMHVMPDMDSKLQLMKAADVAKLAQRVDDVAIKLLLLKQLFPQANVSSICTECTHILLLDVQQFEAAVHQVQRMLAGASDPSALLNAMPMLLDPDVLQEVLQGLQRLFGGSCQPLQLLQQNPSLALSCVSLKGQSRGDRDAEYLGRIFARSEQQSSTQ